MLSRTGGNPLQLPPSIETPLVSGGDPAKALIAHALAPVIDDLRELERRLAGYIPTATRSGRAVIDHVLGAGGKRIRPALFFMCSRLLGYQGDQYFPIAAVSEFVHTASLLHDDVVDNSTLRRNKPTANSIHGNLTSVLVGDLIFSRASEMMAATGIIEIGGEFGHAIRLMSDGELLQLESLFNADLSEETYLRILECKTAMLIAATCKSAGLLARASEEVKDALARFGHGIGMAFQLIDDALDYAGEEVLTGKDTLADLREGKVTMPIILLMKTALPAEVAAIRRGLAHGSLDQETILEAARLVDHYDTIGATLARAHDFTRAAMDALYHFPASAERDALENLANKLLFRFN